MPKYKRLSDDDLLLAIDRTRVEIEGQKQIVAGLAAAAVGFQDEMSIPDQYSPEVPFESSPV